jgi:hypothetical protein
VGDWLTPFVVLVEWVFVSVRTDIAPAVLVLVDTTHLNATGDLLARVQDEDAGSVLSVVFLEVHAYLSGQC